MVEIFQYIRLCTIVQNILDLCPDLFQYNIFFQIFMISLINLSAVSGADFFYNFIGV